MLQNDLSQNAAIDFNTLTFGQLSSMVGTSEEISRLPKVSQLRKSDTPILFKADYEDALITIYQNGLLIYEHGDHATVSTVDRCASPTYFFTASEQESANGGNVVGCIGQIRKTPRGDILVSSIPESEFADLSWYLPIYYACETRLDHNQESREEHRSEFTLDGTDDWDDVLQVPDVLDMFVSLDDQEVKEKLITALHDALRILTEKQYRVIHLRFFEGYKQNEIAAEMNISQPMVHKHLEAAYARLREELLSQINQK